MASAEAQSGGGAVGCRSGPSLHSRCCENPPIKRKQHAETKTRKDVMLCPQLRPNA
jgi:hypothetical protein